MEQRFGKILITVGCLYETVALWSRLPTITNLNHRAFYHPKLWLLGCLWLVVWVHHFVPQFPRVKPKRITVEF